MINQVEASACVVAPDTWGPRILQSDVLHVIVSNTSLSSFINGWSRKSDTCKLVGEYWLRASKHQLYIYLDRVESKSNIADGPTKGRIA